MPPHTGIRWRRTSGCGSPPPPAYTHQSIRRPGSWKYNCVLCPIRLFQFVTLTARDPAPRSHRAKPHRHPSCHRTFSLRSFAVRRFARRTVPQTSFRFAALRANRPRRLADMPLVGKWMAAMRPFVPIVCVEKFSGRFVPWLIRPRSFARHQCAFPCRGKTWRCPLKTTPASRLHGRTQMNGEGR
jgi:hypothetical protein